MHGTSLAGLIDSNKGETDECGSSIFVGLLGGKQSLVGKGGK